MCFVTHSDCVEVQNLENCGVTYWHIPMGSYFMPVPHDLTLNFNFRFHLKVTWMRNWSCTSPQRHMCAGVTASSGRSWDTSCPTLQILYRRNIGNAGTQTRWNCASPPQSRWFAEMQRILWLLGPSHENMQSRIETIEGVQWFQCIPMEICSFLWLIFR